MREKSVRPIHMEQKKKKNHLERSTCLYENLLTSLSFKQKSLHQDSGQSKHHWRCLPSSFNPFRHPFISHAPDGLKKLTQHKCKSNNFSRQLGGSTLGSWAQCVSSSVVTSEVGTQKTHNAPAALWFCWLIGAVCWEKGLFFLAALFSCVGLWDESMRTCAQLIWVLFVSATTQPIRLHFCIGCTAVAQSNGGLIHKTTAGEREEDKKKKNALIKMLFHQLQFSFSVLSAD